MMRILILGYYTFDYGKPLVQNILPSRADEEIVNIRKVSSDLRSDGLEQVPRIPGFDIALINLPAIADGTIISSEIKEFLLSGGILACTLCKAGYSWCPFDVHVSGSIGDVIPKPGVFADLFTTFSLTALASLSDPGNAPVTAADSAGNPVSAIFTYGGGKVIFLPSYQGQDRLGFDRSLLEILKDMYQ